MNEENKKKFKITIGNAIFLSFLFIIIMPIIKTLNNQMNLNLPMDEIHDFFIIYVILFYLLTIIRIYFLLLNKTNEGKQND